jgi:DNA-binding MarR family transcriptional regulator
MATPRIKPRNGNTESREEIVVVVDSIRSIVQSLRISGREAEQRLGVSSAQLYVLQELRDRPALSINELAERTYTHQSSVSMVVARLVENGLVRRSIVRGDARRLSISLTSAGRSVLRRAEGSQTALITALRSMSRSQLRALAGNLNELTGILETRNGALTKAEIALRA